MSEFETVWERESEKDLACAELDSTRVRFRAQSALGRAMLASARPWIYSFAIEDAPKIRWLQRALEGTGKDVLDVGVRTGVLARMLRAMGKRVYGIDLAGAYIDHCRRQGFIEAGRVCNIEREEVPRPCALVPGRSDGYDVVVLSEVIEHLLDGRSAIARLARSLRPGGCLILTTPNLAYAGNRLRVLLGRDLDGLTMDRGEVGNQHIRVFTAGLLTRLCRDAGLDVDMVGSDGIPITINAHVGLDVQGQDAGVKAGWPVVMTLPGSGRAFPTFGRTLYIRAVRRR